MSTEAIPTGATEPITMTAKDADGAVLTGLADLGAAARRRSDGWFLDWLDMTFKADGHTMIRGLLAEVDAVVVPGVYSRDFDTSDIENPVADDVYDVDVRQTVGSTVANGPHRGTIRTGAWVDAVHLTRKKLTNDRGVTAGNPGIETLRNDDGSVLSISELTDSQGNGIRAAIGEPAHRTKDHAP